MGMLVMNFDAQSLSGGVQYLDARKTIGNPCSLHRHFQYTAEYERHSQRACIHTTTLVVGVHEYMCRFNLSPTPTDSETLR
jgi:hypothetical protein